MPRPSHRTSAKTKRKTRRTAPPRRGRLLIQAGNWLARQVRRVRQSLARRAVARQSAVRRSPCSPKTPPPVEAPRVIDAGLSLDQRLDILGVILTFIGLPLALLLLSSANSPLAGGVLTVLRRAFGWGTALFPLGLAALGLWLILRKFEHIPALQLERVAGISLFYVGLLGALHGVAMPLDRAEALSLAQAGRGGGLVGAYVFATLQTYLGWGGAAIALLAGLLIASALTLDVSVIGLFGWVSPLIERLQDAWDDYRTRKFITPLRSSVPPRTSAPPAETSRPAGGQLTGETSPSQAVRAFTPQVGASQPWVLPSINQILDPGGETVHDDEIDRQRARIIEQTLASFGAPVRVVEINHGPTITQFGVEPDFVETRNGRMRVRVGKISALANDLALALSARTIRVQAPVPGKGYVGIEVPNEEIALVALRDVIESEAFRRLKSPLRFALGQDVAGNAVAADLSAMPHLLIAGATGSGKSVCVNAIITCLLLHNTPDDLRLIMVDPKRVELTNYNYIPHLLAPVVVEMERVVGALQWILREMDTRYHKLAQAGTRNIVEFNAKVEAGALPGQKKLPRLVVFIDELADLMMLAPDETERTITRLAQLARATGIHLVIATQRPSVDVVTGLIKANFPARIAFAVAAGVDSRVILDQPGAEQLLGRGDMLFQAPDAPAALRLQGAFVSDAEIQRLVDYWRGFAGKAAPLSSAASHIVDAPPPDIPLKQMPLWEDMQPQEEGDPLYPEAVDLARRQGRASSSMLQRRLRIGYTRATRLIETMQEKGIISKESGPQGFEVLDYGPAAPPAEEA